MNKLLCTLPLLALPLLPTTASAQDYAPSRRARERSKFEAEIRFGAYRPDVDSAFSNAKPYDTVFGDSTRFMLGAEFDWHPLYIPHFGSLGVGGMFGYTKATANARFSDGSGESAEDTAFSMWLFSALAVLRVDVLAKETAIPLVPYAKIGPGVGLWSTENGLGTSEVDGVLGRGRTFGMIYALGGMLMLDFLDRQAAKTFAAEQGVYHTYFFGEFTWADLHGMGQSNAMHVGDKTWTAGIAMEF